MRMQKWILGAITLFSFSDAFANSDCPEQVRSYQNAQIQIVESSVPGRCFLQLTPRDGYATLKYRSFLFSSDGGLLIFDSFGPGDESKMTATAEFIFQPIKTLALNFEFDNGQVRIKHSTGQDFVFDAQSLEPLEITDVKFQWQKKIDPIYKGGLKIESIKSGYWVDLGYKVGGNNSTSPNNKSHINNNTNKTCQVRNMQLFNYTESGDNIWKFGDEDSFNVFLKKSCPQLL